MNDTIDLANHAAQQNDRWLFIAALIVLGIVIVAVARYFVAEHSAAARDHRELMADHKTAQETYHKNLADLVERTNKTNQELAVCLDRNTRAFEEVCSAVRFCRENNNNRKL
jgi:uncharacterized membrane-anchored protein YhcB (DUF1043 family)